MEETVHHLAGSKISNYYLKIIGKKQNIKIASISGRFFAMDRDNRWDRIQKAYKAIIEGTAQKKTNQIGAIEESYKKK